MAIFFFLNLCNTGNRSFFFFFCGSSVLREIDVNVNTFSWLESYVVNLLMTKEWDKYSLCKPPKINVAYFILHLFFTSKSN